MGMINRFLSATDTAAWAPWLVLGAIGLYMVGYVDAGGARRFYWRPWNPGYRPRIFPPRAPRRVHVPLDFDLARRRRTSGFIF